MKIADKVKAKYFCIIGSNEINSGTITIKNLEDKSEKTLKIEQF
jgi:histidyl-tRNA synthetase